MKAFTSVAIALASFASFALAAPAKRQSFPTTVTVDDADKSVTYSGQWTHLTDQGNIVHDGTESYSPDSSASLSIPSHTGEGVSQTYRVVIKGGKKNDRGYFDVFVGDTKVGQGDALDTKASEETSTQTLFDNNVTIDGTTPIIIKNVENDPRISKTPYLAFDFAELTFNEP